MAAAAQHQIGSKDGAENGTDWDEIIPEAERQKVEEEERRKVSGNDSLETSIPPVHYG